MVDTNSVSFYLTFNCPDCARHLKTQIVFKIKHRHQSGYSYTATSHIKLANACTCFHHSNPSNLAKMHVQLSQMFTCFLAVTFFSVPSLFKKNVRPKSKIKNDSRPSSPPIYHHTENPEISTTFAAGICARNFDLNMPLFGIVQARYY